MSAITGIGDFMAMIGRASASSWDGQATRTMSQPAALSSAICCSVALMFVVGVVVIDWTLMGLCEPTPTEPTRIWRVGRLGERTGWGAAGMPRLTEVTNFLQGIWRAGPATRAPWERLPPLCPTRPTRGSRA